MQINNTSKSHKQSPKNNSAPSYIQKQNPFKGPLAAAPGMQQHVQYVNQPHHLVMPGHPTTTSGSAAMSEEMLNLQQLYPQS